MDSPPSDALIKERIRECLLLKKDKEATLDTLYQDYKISKEHATQVWEQMENDYKDFFSRYQISLEMEAQFTSLKIRLKQGVENIMKDQIQSFNDIVDHTMDQPIQTFLSTHQINLEMEARFTSLKIQLKQEAEKFMNGQIQRFNDFVDNTMDQHIQTFLSTYQISLEMEAQLNCLEIQMTQEAEKFMIDHNQRFNDFVHHTVKTTFPRALDIHTFSKLAPPGAVNDGSFPDPNIIQDLSELSIEETSVNADGPHFNDHRI